MNRFDNGSVSAYTPQSFEELAFVPMLKRKQHDEMSKNLADLSVIPVDPLDQHRDEALQLKQDLESRLTNLSSDLASKGIDNLGKENFYKLQKERNDLIAPTGKIGRINEAKKIYEEEFKNYLEDATKNKGFSREDALYNWQTQHLPKYTGYDDKKNIINIDSYSAPKRHILQDDLKTVKSLLGENTQTLMKNNGFNFQEGPNGSIVVMDGKGRVVETTNIPQLQEAANYLNSRWIQPTGEGTMSAKFERIDPKRIVSEINSGLGMMRSYKLDDTRETDYSIQGYKNSLEIEDPQNPDYEGVNVEGVSITKNSDLLDIMNNDSNTTTTYGPGRSLYNDAAVPTTKNKTTKSEFLNSKQYLQLAKSITRTQKLGNDLKSKKVQDAVKKYLNENKDVTIQNRYVDPNTNKQGMLFASKELTGKDSGERASNLILDRARRGAYDVVDEEGNKIDKNDLGKYAFTYNGDMTPKSQIGKKGKGLFSNPKQNIGARTGVLIDKETGEAKTVYVSRGSDDFDTPQFKAMETINGISKIADVQPGIYHQIKSPLFTAYGLKNVEIKYNKNKNSYNLSYIDNDGTNVDQEFPDSKFQEFILNAYGSINK